MTIFKYCFHGYSSLIVALLLQVSIKTTAPVTNVDELSFCYSHFGQINERRFRHVTTWHSRREKQAQMFSLVDGFCAMHNSEKWITFTFMHMEEAFK